METEAVKPLIDRAKELFTKVYGGEAEIITSAPGRLHFGGEHCDYMGGYVLPFPTILGGVVAGRRVEGKVTGIVYFVTVALSCLFGVFSADDRVRL